MRSLKTLLVLLVAFIQEQEVDNIDEHGIPLDGQSMFFDFEEDTTFNGMCSSIRKLVAKNLISEKEFYVFNKFFKENMIEHEGVYWWYPVVKDKRIEWLNNQIKSL
jgi:hypothetical protein